MKHKFIFLLMLAWTFWLPVARGQETTVQPPKPPAQSFESLLNAALPGVTWSDRQAMIYGSASNRLSLAQWNQLALAAARELSLRTTNGLTITADTVDKQPWKSPAEAALLDLHKRNMMSVSFLRDLSYNHLLSASEVIGPLIDMLDYPGKNTAIRREAAQTLTQVTGRPYTEFYQYSEGERDAKISQGWHGWWTMNQTRHPVFDDTLKQAVIARLVVIEKQLYLGISGYSELQYLHPTQVRITFVDPAVRYQQEVGCFMSSQGHIRVAADGSFRAAVPGKDDTLLWIKAQFTTVPFPRTPPPDTAGRAWWQGKIEEVYHEQLPGTDMAIIVEAACQDGVFTRLVRECLEKPAESITTQIARLIEKLEDETESAGAAIALINVGEYPPVIAALMNRNVTIQRNAINALASSGPDGLGRSVGQDAVFHLLHLLKTGDAYTRLMSTRALGHLQQEDEQTTVALIAAMDDADAQASTGAIGALANFRSQEKIIVPAVIKRLSNTNAALRIAVIRTLGELSPAHDQKVARTIVATLINSLADPDRDVRTGVAWALGANGELAKEAFPILLKLADSEDARLRNAVRSALVHIDFETAKRMGFLN